ncbi:MAG: hypothetical protein RBR68_08175, partial [Tenuifilaceae bacterium]|nr:hypothetical protein [Tenuifilaceae bacterium]
GLLIESLYLQSTILQLFDPAAQQYFVPARLDINSLVPSFPSKADSSCTGPALAIEIAPIVTIATDAIKNKTFFFIIRYIK